MLGLYSCNLREGLQFCRWVFGSGYFQHNIDIFRYCTFCIARGIQFSVCLLYNFFFSIFFLEHIICWEYSRYQALGSLSWCLGHIFLFACRPAQLYTPPIINIHPYIFHIYSKVFHISQVLYITCIILQGIYNMSQIYFFLPAPLHSSILPSIINIPPYTSCTQQAGSQYNNISFISRAGSAALFIPLIFQNISKQ